PNALTKAMQEASREIQISSCNIGSLLFIATPLKNGEKIPEREKVRVGEKVYKRLHVGDKVEQGQILAQVDTQLAEHDLNIGKAKLKLAEAELAVAEKASREAELRFSVMNQVKANPLSELSSDELKGFELMWKRSVAEVKSKQAAIEVAQLEVER